MKEHICQSENGTVYLTDIEKKLKGQYSVQEIGRAMKNVFKGTIIKSVRNKEFWSKLTKLYMGVEWKPSVYDTCDTETVSCSSKTNKTNESSTMPENYIEGSDSSSNNIHSMPTSLDHSYCNQDIQLRQSDHEDMKIIINSVTSDESWSDIYKTINMTEKQTLLMKSQVQNIKGNPQSRRWNPEVIRLCLSLYCRSPKNYDFLSKSGYLILPSASHIKRFKNKVDQKSGINKDVLQWMMNEARLINLPKEGYEGGLLIDEMSIQPDLQLKRIGQEYQLIGFTECSEESRYIDILTGKHDIKLATHVLQFLFIGQTGFRFPVAHFPTAQAYSRDLYLTFWRLVQQMGLFGFNVTYISIDGAQSNRTFMKMFLPENQATSDSMETMLFENIFDSSLPKISIIMDYSHVMKKIRNNILKSGHFQYNKKLLYFNDKFIVWDHWLKAYQWDISSNTLKVYPQLTEEHFHLNSQLKMRNKLAENVLNKDMLHLMEIYQKTIGEKGADLNSSIELLKNTSVLVEIFRDKRPLKTYEDSRLMELRNVLLWFRNWEKSVINSNISNKEKSLLSSQTREDIVSCIKGFDSMCFEKFKRSSGSIIPARINSDPIENIFSQQRGIHNGANSNPDYLTYCRTMNSIILGESSLSSKSNAADTNHGAMFYIPKRQALASLNHN